MKLYLIPTTPLYEYEPYNHIYLVSANSDEEAYNKAKSKLNAYIPQELPKYESYDINISKNNLPISPFHESEKYGILNPIFLNTKGLKHMAYFKVNWNKYTKQLSQIADQENWSNDTYPNNGILANYIVKTYDKLTSEKKIVIGEDYALFNTGLFNKYFDPLYAYQTGADISFLTGYELSNIGISARPEKANYFEKPELLLFNWHYSIDVYYKHILDDKKNQSRLPKEFLNSDNKINIINGALDTMKKRVSANYKLAIPQYYEGKIQLLLPLCLMSDTKPDIAIAVTKKDNCYQGHTCLTLDMAYNNARLIARPESNWLMAENITKQ
jgi:hypothetical protein